MPVVLKSVACRCVCRTHSIIIEWWCVNRIHKMDIAWWCVLLNSHRAPFKNLSLPNQPSATSPLFFDNLHFEHFDKSFNLDSWLTFLSKCTPPKRRLWNAEPAFPNTFSNPFSRAWVLDLGYESLKSASKNHSEMLFRLSKIFVWGA